MIRIDFEISNPFKHKPWKSLWQGEWIVSKNKTFHIGFFRYAYNILEFKLDLRWKGHDHAGPCLDIGIFGCEMVIALNDTRHWDHENNTWVKYDAE